MLPVSFFSYPVINYQLSDKFAHFRQLLEANNKIMTRMADMEEKLSGDYLFDFQYIFSSVTKLREETNAMVNALNKMADNHYNDLSEAFQRIMTEVEENLYGRGKVPVTSLVLSFEDLNSTMTEMVGIKNANIGEVNKRLDIPVPHGFAISTYAYKIFLDYNNLQKTIIEVIESCSLDDLESLERTSEEIKQIIRKAKVPPELEDALYGACQHLVQLPEGSQFLAIRTSPVHDDITFFDHQQYAIFLNVTYKYISVHYKDIIASFLLPGFYFIIRIKASKKKRWL